MSFNYQLNDSTIFESKKSYSMQYSVGDKLMNSADARTLTFNNYRLQAICYTPAMSALLPTWLFSHSSAPSAALRDFDAQKSPFLSCLAILPPDPPLTIHQSWSAYPSLYHLLTRSCNVHLHTSDHSSPCSSTSMPNRPRHVINTPAATWQLFEIQLSEIGHCTDP